MSRVRLIRALTKRQASCCRYPKTLRYCLNPDNPRGRHKARLFASALGLTVVDAAALRGKLLEVARTGNAEIGERDVYGQRYTMEFTMVTGVGRARVRSGWIILRGRREPRLTTCYVVKRKQ